MVVHKADKRIEKKEKLRGGEGTTTFAHFVESGVVPNLRLGAELSLEPGGSIGYHQHVGEAEIFVFLEGTGVVNDNGTDIPVSKGDVMVTGDGSSHSVKNTGNVPLVFSALIVTG
jgi:mannose-6-phosphate isomerase-like protein (cupin superfamily)